MSLVSRTTRQPPIVSQSVSFSLCVSLCVSVCLFLCLVVCLSVWVYCLFCRNISELFGYFRHNIDQMSFHYQKSPRQRPQSFSNYWQQLNGHQFLILLSTNIYNHFDAILLRECTLTHNQNWQTSRRTGARGCADMRIPPLMPVYLFKHHSRV